MLRSDPYLADTIVLIVDQLEHLSNQVRVDNVRGSTPLDDRSFDDFAERSCQRPIDHRKQHISCRLLTSRFPHQLFIKITDQFALILLSQRMPNDDFQQTREQRDLLGMLQFAEFRRFARSQQLFGRLEHSHFDDTYSKAALD